jgi:hypothetical protein
VVQGEEILTAGVFCNPNVRQEPAREGKKIDDRTGAAGARQEGCATEDAANCMKPTPPPEEAACPFRPQVEFLTLQPFVGRQNHDNRQRNNQQQE